MSAPCGASMLCRRVAGAVTASGIFSPASRRSRLRRTDRSASARGTDRVAIRSSPLRARSAGWQTQQRSAISAARFHAHRSPRTVTRRECMNHVHERSCVRACARIVRTFFAGLASKCYISDLGATPRTQSRHHASRPARRHRCSGAGRGHLRRRVRAIQPLPVLLAAHDGRLSSAKLCRATRLGSAGGAAVHRSVHHGVSRRRRLSPRRSRSPHRADGRAAPDRADQRRLASRVHRQRAARVRVVRDAASRTGVVHRSRRRQRRESRGGA